MKKIFIFFLFFISVTNAQEFGKNKVRYHHFAWETYLTNHFEILYYDCDLTLIKEIEKMAEQAYEKVTNSLKYIPSKITPLIIYKSHNEFEETNVSPDFIGEGVGGFTTLLKDRIVIPLDFSKKELQRVITHEFTHVVHLNFISEQQINNTPLWFMEGLSEYQAAHWSTYEKMLIRDAILNDTFIPIKDLNDALLGKGSVYLAYKEAHSLIEYIVSYFGEHKLVDLFRYSKETLSFDEALIKSINLNTKELDIVWRIFLKRKYKNFMTKDFVPLNKEKIEDHKNTFSKINPQFSPDGKKIIYFTTKNNFTELFLVDANSSKKEISLSKHLCGKFFENICYTQTGNIFSWNPNNQEIVFIAQQKGKNYIFIENIYNRKIVKKISVFLLDDIISPNWYGDKIIFIGLKNGQSDIYSIDKNGQNLIQWTNDQFQENTPIGLSNNKGIIYSAEQNEGIQIFLLNNPQKNPLPLTKQNNNIQPTISKNGEKIFFISDRNNEIFNLYQMDINGDNLKQITDVNGGIFLPSVFENKILVNVFSKEKMDLDEISLKEIVVPVIQKEKFVYISPYQEKYKQNKKNELKINLREKEIKKEERNFIGDENVIKQKPNLGMTVDKVFPYFYYGLDGGIYGLGLIASDLLGDKYFIFQGENLHLQINTKEKKSFKQQIKNTTFMTNYFSFKNKLDYQIGYFNIPLYYRYLENNNFFLQARYLSGINFNLKYPFDKFKRLETGIICQSDEWENETTYILRGLKSSFVIDNTKTNIFSYSIDGSKNKYTLILVDKILGGNTKFNSIEFDCRKYHSLNNRIILAGRIKLGYNQNNYNFYLGGPNTIRGYEYGEFKGTKFGLSNIEIRTLFFENIMNNIYGVSGVIFIDGGSIFSSIDKKWSDLKISTGLGLRMIFSFMPIIWRFDWAWTVPIKKQPVFYLYWNNMF